MPSTVRSGSLSVVLALLAAVALAACGSSEPSSPATTISATAPATSSIGASGEPSSSVPAETTDASASPSETPSPTAPPTESAPPTQSGTPEVTDAPTATPGEADACTVSNEANREFFVSVADAVEWPVLCAVLPTHWLLSGGTYRLAHGGKMAVDYRGPGGAALNLQEGAFCSDADGCVPSGSEAGDAALGPLAGTLVALDDGGFSIVVDRGASPSWLMTVHGVDQAAAVSIGGAMVQVGS